jgi:anti-anti-sigma factor
MTEASLFAFPSPETGSFECLVFHDQSFARVRPVGELDLATAPVLRAELDALRDAGCRRVVLDLSSLDFMDAAGLRCLVDFDAHARQNGCTLALIPGVRHVQRVFEFTETETDLPFIGS